MFLRPFAVLLLLSGLAGCSGGTDGTTSHGQTCPGWQVGLGHSGVHWDLDERLPNNPTNETLNPDVTLTDSGHPIDVYYMHFDGASSYNASRQQVIRALDSRLTLSFYRADNHVPLLAYDMAKGAPSAKNTGQYHFTYGPGEAHPLLEIRLSQPPSPPTPTALVFDAQWETNLDGNANTISTATIDGTAQFEYRVC
ncbi:MAG: hypothetical protein V4510_05780 [bacterium]